MIRSTDMSIVERRAFPRQPVNHETLLTLPDRTAISVRIIEASERGMRIALARYLETDTPVQVTIDGQVVLGRVCHCGEARQGITSGSGAYVAGLYLENTLAGLEDLAKLSRLLATEENVKIGSSIT